MVPVLADIVSQKDIEKYKNFTLTAPTDFEFLFNPLTPNDF
jgi:hypothetical protein